VAVGENTGFSWVAKERDSHKVVVDLAVNVALA
jgi:hypothetical protein